MLGPAPAVLVTGMSGVGKSTVLAELARRGHETVDTDLAGWTIEVRDAAGDVVDHVWDASRVTALLAAPRRGPVFLGGCVSNQGLWYPHFAAVVLLSVDRDTMLRRVMMRENPYGRSASDRRRILSDLAEAEPLLRASATCELDGTLPVAVLADRLEAVAVGTDVP